jgi:hypothetical protein
LSHPYGDVQDRFFERYPFDATFVQDRYGHAWRDGKRSERYLMSAFVQGASGSLLRKVSSASPGARLRARCPTTVASAIGREGEGTWPR